MKPMKKHTIKQAGTLRSLLLLFGLALGSGLSAQDAAAVLDAVRRQHAPDRRVAVFEIEAERINDTLHILKGKCDDPEAIEALRAAFRGAGIRFADYVKALPDASLKEKNEALVTLSSINLRTAPDHAAEMSTQAIMGTPLRVLEQYDNWYRVQTPDGYIGWTNAASIALKTAEETKRWRSAARYVYTATRDPSTPGRTSARARCPIWCSARFSKPIPQPKAAGSSLPSGCPTGGRAMFFAARSKTSKRGPLVRSIRTGWNGRRGR